MTPREQLIWDLRNAGSTYKAIGEQFGFTSSRAYQLCKRVERKIAKIARNKKIDAAVCKKCNDTLFVCENHPSQEAHACRHCKGAGMPCECTKESK